MRERCLWPFSSCWRMRDASQRACVIMIKLRISWYPGTGTVTGSVADPWHFVTDPDPRSRFSLFCLIIEGFGVAGSGYRYVSRTMDPDLDPGVPNTYGTGSATLVTGTFSDVHVVFCYVLSQYHRTYRGRDHKKRSLKGSFGHTRKNCESLDSQIQRSWSKNKSHATWLKVTLLIIIILL